MELLSNSALFSQIIDGNKVLTCYSGRILEDLCDFMHESGFLHILLTRKLLVLGLLKGIIDHRLELSAFQCLADLNSQNPFQRDVCYTATD